MKIFGYEVTDSEDWQPLLTLREATIKTTPENLRKIAKFILQAADEMEEFGEDFDHMHLQLTMEEFDIEGEPDLIVVR
jgi:hypothetical protein